MSFCCRLKNRSQMAERRVALVGNPNGGKTTLFNALTGARQQIGNWPGVTVERMSGYFTETGQTVEVVDLPGTYSLITCADAAAVDECIACDFILSRQADVVVNVVDASHLERHLYLTTQLLEKGVPVILALNRMDVVQAQQLHIDLAALSLAIGCPVVAITANKGQGLTELKQAILSYTPVLSTKVVEERVMPEEEMHAADRRYRFIQQVMQQCLSSAAKLPTTWTARLDRLILNRVLGIPIFLGIMYLLFVFAIDVGGYFQTYFDSASQWLFVDGLAVALTKLGAPAGLTVLLTNGLGKGLNTVVSFVPVMGAMFLFLAALEDSGYMARAAFVMDRFMCALGLPGKAFVPMIIGFGCNVPAVMAARTLERPRDRILTVLMTPFMSCGARLAIYAVFTAAFFPHGGQNVVFLLYLIGIVMAIFTGFLLQWTLLKGRLTPLIMEMPSYHVPHFKTLLRHTGQRLKGFVLRAGKLIVPICALIGVLNTSQGEAHSLLSTMGQWVTPLFAPMGIQADNWPATVGLVTGVLAKEVVVGTLNTLYTQMGHLSGTVDVYGLMYQKFDGQIGAFAYLLFVLLYFPCVSTVAVMLREIHRGWTIFSACWMMGVAYGVAVLFYQAATWARHPLVSSLWVIAIIILFLSTITMIRWIAGRRSADAVKQQARSTSACGGGACAGCPGIL